MDQLLPENEFRYWLTYEGDRIEVRAPEDWDSDSIGQFKRDEKYFGLMRTFGDDINFVLNGYAIIKNAQLKYGYEAEVLFEVERLNRITFSYDPLFKSNLDFGQWKDDSIRGMVKMMESGISAEIKSKENTKYEYALAGTDIVNIIIPGVVFSEKADFIFPNQGESDRFMPAIDLVNNDTNSGYVTVQNVEQQENISDESIFATSGNWLAKGNRASGVPINIKGNIKGFGRKPGVGSGNDFSITIRDNSGSTIATLYQSPSFNAFDFIPFDFDFDLNLTINESQKYFIYIRTDTFPALLSANITEGEMKIAYTQVSDPSNCKGISMLNLYRRIIRRISPQQPTESTLLSTDWANLIVTSGNAIRELTDATVQTTLSDFFDTCNGIESAGMGLDTGVLRLEKRPFFYRPLLIDTLTGIKSCEFSTAVSAVFNALEIGYDDGNTDDIDGQFEFNSKQEYSMPISRIQRKESWISPYRADQYGIEKLRVDFIKKTSDTSSDNDVFMFDCYLDGDNYRPILGSSYVSVSGMSSEEANLKSYNLRLSPKENLLRHGSYLGSIFDKYPARVIAFASAEKNKNLVYTRVGNPNLTVSQKADVLIGIFSADKYFKPIEATLTAKLPVGFMAKMDSSAFGFIRWEWENQIYEGFVLDVGVDLAKNKEREIRLLLTTNNNL